MFTIRVPIKKSQSETTKKQPKKTTTIMAEVHENHENTIDKAARALGIVGTSLGGVSLLSSGALSKILNGLANPCGCQAPAANYSCSSPMPVTPEEIYLERKQNSDYVDITKRYYEGKIEEIRDIDRKFAEEYARNSENAFQLYKYSRDAKEDLDRKIESVDKKVDVMLAVRPYQDALIDAKMNSNAILADFNLYRRTCRTINGELVLPSTPTVTGYASYSPFSCNCPSTASTGA